MSRRAGVVWFEGLLGFHPGRLLVASDSLWVKKGSYSDTLCIVRLL